MRKIILVMLIAVTSAYAQNKTNSNEKYASFGAKISKEGALSKEQATAKYAKLKAGDTMAVKFRSKIVDVCSKKGCWMNLELAKGKTAFVKIFKDLSYVN
jgi:hypothetical protein